MSTGGQDLLDEICGARRGVANFRELLLARPMLGDLQACEIGVAKNRRQHVVEVMGNRAGNQTQPLELRIVIDLSSNRIELNGRPTPFEKTREKRTDQTGLLKRGPRTLVPIMRKQPVLDGEDPNQAARPDTRQIENGTQA